MTPKQWADRMRRTAWSQGWTLEKLADEIPMARSAIYRYGKGDRMPTIQTAEAIARILDAPYLAEEVVNWRQKQCIVCGATYVDKGTNHAARFCGVPCNRTYRARMDRAMLTESNAHAAIIAKRRLKKYSLAVVAFCRACEPEGMCRNQACELRKVSPLPLVVRKVG